MSEVTFVGVPQPILRAALADLSGWRVMGERFLERAKEFCPVSKGNSVTGSSSGSLKASMEVRFEYGFDPRILVGSTLTRGDNRVSALGLIELGTVAHGIDPVNVTALRFTGKSGQTVFAKHVNHPGTRKNQFVERAIRGVVLETVII
jgi:hypothetical protein